MSQEQEKMWKSKVVMLSVCKELLELSKSQMLLILISEVPRPNHLIDTLVVICTDP